ncbi:MAG: AGE family epimerase/isomerase [Bacteroidales bacterium]|nr:MAG: AGE family epimerase/isomerase [Bacteroidales bacterium]
MPATVNTESLKKELLQILKENILDYWIKHTIDRKYGGFLGYVNSNNEANPKASKGIILNTRILWTFSAAAKFLKDSYYKETADLAYNYIRDKFLDNNNGGVYWELNYKGEPLNRKKQIYAQAFAIYALSEYYLVTRKDEALEMAKEIYYLIEKYSYDSKYEGYIEAFSDGWSDLEDVRLSEKDRNAKKTMNTHLHILEAYTNLYRIWPDGKVYDSLKRLINVFADYFINDQNHLNLFFSEKWELTDIIISYGHDIEFSWLFTEAGEVINDPFLLNKTKSIAVNMVDRLINEGFDSDGGIVYELNPGSNHLDHDKHWWVQAEGMVGLVNAYQITGKYAYLEKAIKLWNFIDSFIIDHKYGEWFWRVNRQGMPYKEDEKAGFWKCPYHNSRTCIEIINRLEEVKS